MKIVEVTLRLQVDDNVWPADWNWADLLDEPSEKILEVSCKDVGKEFDAKSHEDKCNTVCNECGQSAPPYLSTLHEDTCSLHPDNEVKTP